MGSISPVYTLNNARIKEVQKWFSVNGDGTLRMNYSLNEDSVVVDLGGYRGQFTYDIYRRYKCNVHVFEPYLSYYKVIDGRFKSNEKIKVYDYGVSLALALHYEQDNPYH